MNAIKALELMNEYEACPECGSVNIGNAEGSVEIHDDTFKRTCKCGWSVVIKEK